MEPASLIVGAGLLVVGYVAGLLTRRRQARPPTPICACSHSYGAHADGQCHAEVQREKRDRSTLSGYSREWVRCACRRYTGPEPISSDIWVPPMIDGHRLGGGKIR